MMTQLHLPLASADGASRAPRSLWIMAGEERNTAGIERFLAQRNHFFVNGLTGGHIVHPDDVLLLRDPRSKAYQVFITTSGESTERQKAAMLKQLLVAIRSPYMVLDHDRCVHDLLLFAFCPGGIGRPLPYRSSTGLERAVASLRHRDLRPLPRTRLTVCRRVLRVLDGGAHPLLMAIFDREAGDALHSLTRADADPDSAEAMTRALQRAATLFRAHGLNAQWDVTCALLRQLPWTGTGADAQMSLPFPPLPNNNPDRDHSGQTAPALGYSFRKLFGRRVPLAKEVCDWPQFDGAVQRRTFIGTLPIPDRLLCTLMAGIASRTYRSVGTVRPDDRSNEGGTWRMRVGLDAELAVLLDMAGRTGLKPGMYTLVPHSETCRFRPLTASSTVGKLVDFLVQPLKAGRHDLLIDMLVESRCTATVKLSFNC